MIVIRSCSAPHDDQRLPHPLRPGLPRPDAYATGVRTLRVLGELAAAARLEAEARSRFPGAPRPRDTSLDITRAREELGWTPRSLDLALREGRLG